MIRRNVLITTASVAGVIVAGAAVVGANVRILDSTADEGVGELSATTVPVVEEVSVGGVDESQSYAVEAAGMVSVERVGGELRLGEVSTTPGWTHTVSQQDATVLVISFTDGTTTYQFLATIGADGRISAGVSQPVDEVVVIPGQGGASSGAAGAPASGGSAPARSTGAAQDSSDNAPPAPAPPRAGEVDDDHGYGEYESEPDDDHYEEHESEEHEGGEDDD